MIKRIFIFAGFFLCVQLAALHSFAAIPESRKIVFQILRNGDNFGTHSLVFSRNDSGETVVDITIDMAFSLGPITLFRYEHSNQEIWKDNALLALRAQTNDDGKDYFVEAEWAADKVDVSYTADGAASRYEAPPGLYSTSYWNPVTVQADQLINTQKGLVEDIKVTKLEPKTIDVAGQPRMADGYRVEAVVPITVWYDQKTSQWVGLDFKVRGSDMSYRRLTPIDGSQNNVASN
jgi:hypothetical protein